MDACPYCGAVVAQDRTVDAGDARQGRAGIGYLLLSLLALIVFLTLNHANVNIVPNSHSDAEAVLRQSCLIAACPGGTRAITRTADQQPYYTCKSSELSDYANYVLGVMLAQMQSAGYAPKISSNTGEPVVQGKEQEMLDRYRASAGVSSFEEALSRCYRGSGNIDVVVLFNPEKGGSIYVSAVDKQNDKFWLPKKDLDKL